MLTGKGHEGTCRGDVSGCTHVYLLKSHQVVHLRFLQITLGKLYLYMKKKNEIFIDLQK